MDEPPTESVHLADTPFIQDQESLQNPMGVLVTLAMVIVAAVLCGVAIFLSL
jgi:flagellin-like protein